MYVLVLYKFFFNLLFMKCYFVYTYTGYFTYHIRHVKHLACCKQVCGPYRQFSLLCTLYTLCVFVPVELKLVLRFEIVFSSLKNYS